MKIQLNLITLLVGGVFLANTLRAAPATSSAPPAESSVIVTVAPNAPPQVQQAAASILASLATQPLLKVVAGEHPPTSLSDSVKLASAPPADRAYNHIVVVGLPDDPLITAGWQREALLKDGDFYIFGFGHLKGDIGYLESDRNPFLHSRFIPTAPYETEMVTITGSTPAGVALAAQAFIDKGLVNGVVASPGWQRTAPNLLQHDPLDPAFALPDWVPAQLGEWTKVGVTQASEDEYRGVVQDTEITPQEIWRVKYYKPGVWSTAGAPAAFENYSAGLHRRASGNSLWLARFNSPEEAATAAAKIAANAKLSKKQGIYLGEQPRFSPTNLAEVPGPLSLWLRGNWVLMSTLPQGVAEDVLKSSP